jgi:FkbM family methyltransferase
VREHLFNIRWRLGVRLFHLLKRIPFFGRFEHTVLAVTDRLFPPPPDEVRVSLPYGLKMAIPPRLPRARTYIAGMYEEGVTALIRSLLSEGNTFIDVGAFCGYYTLLGSRLVGPTGRVLSFEPFPLNYSYLERNIGANCCRNVTAVNKAVSSTTGVRYLVLHGEPDHHWLSTAVPTRRYIETSAIRLDDFFQLEGWPLVHLVKIDVEGTEKDVLKGMGELSRRNPWMRLIMEFDRAYLRRSGTQPNEMALQLLQLGFQKGYVIEKGMSPVDLTEGMPGIAGTYNVLFTKGHEQRNTASKQVPVMPMRNV